VATETELLHGTLDLLILKAIALQELHGLGVSRRIEQLTRGAFVIGPGSLFPALHRLESQGWLTASWGESENNRKAKFYTITASGTKQLKVELAQWDRVVAAMRLAIEAT
jgi:transcriptional regulator